MATLKNKYATDASTGLLVDIEHSTNTGTYRCAVCGEVLIRKIGNGGKVSHFSHSSGVTHDGETLLHKLGKLVIKERFNKAGSKLPLKFYRYLKCKDFDNCKIHQECENFSYSDEYDLKKGYSRILEETPIYYRMDNDTTRVEFEPFDGCTELIPDLFLYHPNKPLSQGIMIEICYTHPCSQDKIDSGIKIIELYIKNEESLDKFKTETIVEEEEPCDRRKKRSVILYNFNTDRVRSSERYEEGVFSRFIYFKSGGCTTPELHDPVRCDNRNVKKDKFSMIELNISGVGYFDNPSILQCGLAYLIKNRGLDIRNCLLCKFYHGYEDGNDYPLCALYKKYGLKQHPRQTNAKTCNHYTIKQDILTFIQNNKELYIEEV